MLVGRAGMPDHGGMQDVAFRPRRQRLEWPTRRQRQFVSVGQGIDARGIEAHHRSTIRALAERLAVASRDDDLIANGDVFEKPTMRIAVRGIDRNATLPGSGCELDMTGPEGQRLAAASSEHDGAGM